MTVISKMTVNYYFIVLKSEEHGVTHRETSHFKKWLEEAVPLMAEPRTRVVYRDVPIS